MLSDFLADHRDELVNRCATKVARRPRRDATPLQLSNGVPMFLSQLQRTLEAEQTGRLMESVRLSGASGGAASIQSEMGVSASEHGSQLALLGYTVDQVVHDYGDLCQAITEMATEKQVPVAIEEFRTLNRCLDNVIAIAVGAFATRTAASALQQTPVADAERDQLRNSLAAASYAAKAMEVGNLPICGSTGSVLKRSLVAMRAVLGEPGIPGE